MDKSNIPLYCVLSGAGSGKSKFLNELPTVAIEAISLISVTQEDTYLKELLLERLRKAFVFNLSFENGTSLNTSIETDPYTAIGNRMLYQLIGKGIGWMDFQKMKYTASPETIIDLLVKNHNLTTNTATFFVSVDGMQTTLKNTQDGKNKESYFYNCLLSLTTMSRRPDGPFIIFTLAATMSVPVSEFLSDSHGMRIFLPLATLIPPTRTKNGEIHKVFPKHRFLDMLVDDMGGHGRALEILEYTVQKFCHCNFQESDIREIITSLDNIVLDDLLKEVMIDLRNKYSEWIPVMDVMGPIIRIILTHTRVKKNQLVFENSNLTIDEALQFGLIKFKEIEGGTGYGYLECGYVFLWLYAYVSQDGLLKCWNFNYLQSLQNTRDPTVIPSGLSHWQNFEEFLARFRIMKSQVYQNGSILKSSMFHYGARMNVSDKKIFINKHLSYQKSSKWHSTKSENYKLQLPMLCETGQVAEEDYHSYYYVNAPGAPYGDGFVPLKTPGHRCFNEIHQAKRVSDKISQTAFEQELQKAASSNDFFILFTTNDYDDALPPSSAVVDRKNWEAYFGPFAGRAFFYFNKTIPSANYANLSILTTIKGIGKAAAENIIRKRKTEPYNDLEDCHKRTKIPKNLLRKLSFEVGTSTDS
ncbi:hypothetical protein HK096_005287 [Nowakowskiella sp. JEL0078]|nr:hypothetical protein HK096_005287 [Nowakowskiella sp. JEL0078]